MLCANDMVVFAFTKSNFFNSTTVTDFLCRVTYFTDKTAAGTVAYKTVSYFHYHHNKPPVLTGGI